MTQVANANPGDGITQAGIASDHAKQALLGSGVQNIYFGEREPGAEPTISLAPPFGLRDDRLPMRGRVLTAQLRVLGPDHPSTKRTAAVVAYLERHRAK